MEFLTEFGLFLAKMISIVIALLVIVGSLAGLNKRKKKQEIDEEKEEERENFYLTC